MFEALQNSPNLYSLKYAKKDAMKDALSRLKQYVPKFSQEMFSSKVI